VSDIFISCARSTKSEAKRIAEALHALGYAVWLDDELPAHRDYSEVIEERLRAAKAVVVVWSAEAVKSQWVRAEADLAREAGTLVQLTLDGAPLPLPFKRIESADLRGWRGEPAAAGWKKVVESMAELAGRPIAAQKAGQPDAAPPPRRIWRARQILGRRRLLRRSGRGRRRRRLRRRAQRQDRHGARPLFRRAGCERRSGFRGAIPARGERPAIRVGRADQPAALRRAGGRAGVGRTVRLRAR
jgi:hypothetical protein